MPSSTGNYNSFWAARNYVTSAASVHASVFVVHGMNDLNVQGVHFGQWWDALAANNVPRKIWLSQEGHVDPFDFRRAAWVDTLHRWFDFWLHGHRQRHHERADGRRGAGRRRLADQRAVAAGRHDHGQLRAAGHRQPGRARLVRGGLGQPVADRRAVAERGQRGQLADDQPHRPQGLPDPGAHLGPAHLRHADDHAAGPVEQADHHADRQARHLRHRHPGQLPRLGRRHQHADHAVVLGFVVEHRRRLLPGHRQGRVQRRVPGALARLDGRAAPRLADQHHRR